PWCPARSTGQRFPSTAFSRLYLHQIFGFERVRLTHLTAHDHAHGDVELDHHTVILLHLHHGASASVHAGQHVLRPTAAGTVRRQIDLHWRSCLLHHALPSYVVVRRASWARMAWQRGQSTSAIWLGVWTKSFCGFASFPQTVRSTAGPPQDGQRIQWTTV